MPDGGESMKTNWLWGAAIAAFVTGPALAADMPLKAPPPPPAVYDWSGVYVGASLGWIRDSVDRSYDLATLPGFSTQANSALWGGHIGGQEQWNHVVVGFEVGYSATLSPLRSITGIGGPFAGVVDGSESIPSILRGGGRLGWAQDTWLFYATGGFASAHIDSGYVSPATGTAILQPLSGSELNPGWYVGAGLETVVVKSNIVDFIVGVEYEHYEFVNTRGFCALGCSPTTPFDFSTRANADAVVARVSLKTHGWGFFGP
jgi:outer membrane immunogenic protein